MSRFVHLPHNPNGKFDNLRERLETPLPGETMASNDPRYANRLPAFRPQVAANVAPKSSAKRTAPKQASITEVRAEAARQAKVRYRNVMASSAAKGREKQAVALLLASCDRDTKFTTCTAIIAELRKRPTDAQAAAKAKADKTARADRAWDKAAAGMHARRLRDDPLRIGVGK